MLENFRQMLEDSLVGQLGDMVSGVFEDLYNMVSNLDPVSQLGVLVLGGIITILGTFSLIKKLSKLIFVVALIFVIWYVLTNDVLPI